MSTSEVGGTIFAIMVENTHTDNKIVISGKEGHIPFNFSFFGFFAIMGPES